MSDRQQLLLRIQELSFTLDDLHLYLNTHPEDQNALSYYLQVQAQEQQAMQEYEYYFGPLTAQSAAAQGAWTWGQDAWPWEKGG